MDTNQEDVTTNQDLLWDNNTDEDFGDLLDFIMKRAEPAEDSELVQRSPKTSLIRSIQAFIDLQPGFRCLECHQYSETLPQIVRLQLIMEEIQSQLDAVTLKVYSRRHGRKANCRRQIGSLLLVSRSRNAKLPHSYLALMEKLNPVLFNDILTGNVDQLPFPPDNIGYLNRLGQFIDIFERVQLSDDRTYTDEEAYILQNEYDRVYDSLFAAVAPHVSLLGDGQNT